MLVDLVVLISNNSLTILLYQKYLKSQEENVKILTKLPVKKTSNGVV